MKKTLVALVLAALTAVGIQQWRARRSYGSDFVAAVVAEVPERSPERGRILDRNGVPLAENRRAFDVYVTPRLFTRQVRTRLIGLLHLDADEVARLDRAAALGAGVPDRPVRVLEDLSMATPDKLWITEFAETGGNVKISGLGVDEQTVADFMRRLGTSPFFRGVDLEETSLVDQDGIKHKKFVLKGAVNYLGAGTAAASAKNPGAGQEAKP